jgi:hypothetical protein
MGLGILSVVVGSLMGFSLHAQDSEEVSEITGPVYVGAKQISRLDSIAQSSEADKFGVLNSLQTYLSSKGKTIDETVQSFLSDGSLGDQALIGAEWLVLHTVQMINVLDPKQFSEEQSAILANANSMSQVQGAYAVQPQVTYFNKDEIQAAKEEIQKLRSEIVKAEDDKELTSEQMGKNREIDVKLVDKAAQLGQVLARSISNAFRQPQPFETFSGNSEYVQNLLEGWQFNVKEDIVMGAIFAASDVIEADDGFAQSLLTHLNVALVTATDEVNGLTPKVGLHLFTLLNNRLNALLVRYPMAGVKAINAQSAINVVDVWEIGLAALSQDNERIRALGEELVSSAALLVIDLKSSELSEYINTPGLYPIFSSDKVGQTFAGIDYDVIGLASQDASRYVVSGAAIPFGWKVSNAGKTAGKEILNRTLKSRLYSLIPAYTAQTKAELYAVKRIQYDSPLWVAVSAADAPLTELAKLTAKRLWMITGDSVDALSRRMEGVFSAEAVGDLSALVSSAVQEAQSQAHPGLRQFWGAETDGNLISAHLDSGVNNGKGFYLCHLGADDKIYYSTHIRYAKGFSFMSSVNPSILSHNGLPTTFVVKSKTIDPMKVVTEDGIRAYVQERTAEISKIFDFINQQGAEESLALLSDFAEQWTDILALIESEEVVEATSGCRTYEVPTADLYTRVFSGVLTSAMNGAAAAYKNLAWLTAQENESRDKKIESERNRVVAFTFLVLQSLKEGFDSVSISPERAVVIKGALSDHLAGFTALQTNRELLASMGSTTPTARSAGDEFEEGDGPVRTGQDPIIAAPKTSVQSLLSLKAEAKFDAQSIWDQTWRVALTEHLGQLERISEEVSVAVTATDAKSGEPQQGSQKQTQETLRAIQTNAELWKDVLGSLNSEAGFVGHPTL